MVLRRAQNFCGQAYQDTFVHNITFTQSLALLALGLAFFRSSKTLGDLLPWLQQAKENSPLHRFGYILCAAISAIPDFFSSSKAIDLIVLFTKA